MKYLVCLVALLFLCLSPNPSFAQPNSSEVKQLKVVSDYKSEGFWAYENYWAVLGQIDELFFDGEPRQFEQLTTETQKRALIPKYEEFVKGLIKENPKIVEEFIHEIKQFKQLMGDYSDFEDQMIGLLDDRLLDDQLYNHDQLYDRIRKLDDRLRKRLLDLQNVGKLGKLDLRKHLLGISIRKEQKLYRKLWKELQDLNKWFELHDQLHDRITGINDQLHDRINKLGLKLVNNLLATKCTKCKCIECRTPKCKCIGQRIMKKCRTPLLRALAVTIPYSSLEDKVGLDSLKLDEVEFMKRTRQTLFDLGWKDFEGKSLDKFGFQLTKSESPNKSRSSPESPNKSRSSSKSPKQSQRTLSPQ